MGGDLQHTEVFPSLPIKMADISVSVDELPQIICFKINTATCTFVYCSGGRFSLPFYNE